MAMSWPLMIRKVQGHSMVPVLPPGTLVIGLRWYLRIKPGKVIIFTRENREVIKRVHAINNAGLHVLGDHPETSTDSRQYGEIPRAFVQSIVLWPHVSRTLPNDYASPER